MKIIYFLFLLCLSGCCVATQNATETKVKIKGPHAKVVISKDGVVGRYVSEDEKTYVADIQDCYTIDKDSARVEMRSAAAGQGIIYANVACNLYAGMSRQSKVLKRITNVFNGELPDVFPCLGYRKGWFKTKIDGVVGYVNEKDGGIIWDAICSF